MQAELKRQVGVYLRGLRTSPVIMIDHRPVSIFDPKAGGFWCGSGHVDFDISAVKAELTTTIEKVGGVTASFTVPVNMVTVGGSGGYKRDVTNTQVLDFNLWPLERARQDTAQLGGTLRDGELDHAPIAKVLLGLRDALVLSAMKIDYSNDTPVVRAPQPYFTDYSPDKPSADPGDTFKIGRSVLNDANGGISVGVAVLTVGASAEYKSTTGNTLTVSFIQTELGTIQQAKDAVDTLCKYPNGNSLDCSRARMRLAQLAIKGVGVGVADPEIE